jgi:hypothetical protein
MGNKQNEEQPMQLGQRKSAAPKLKRQQAYGYS